MADDWAELIGSYLKQLEAFRTNVTTLNQGQQQVAPLSNQWNAIREALANVVLPKLGSAVQLASRSMLALVSSYLGSVQYTENIQPMGPAMRQVWIGLITAQVSELESLLRNPPIVENVSAGAATTQIEQPDRKEAKNLLVESGTMADDRATSMRRLAISSLISAIAILGSAAAVPFVFRTDPETHGWALLAAWGSRVVAVAVLIIGAIHLLNIFRELTTKAAAATREKDLFRVLAASSFLGNGREQAGALVDLVRSLAVVPEPQNSKESALVVPSSLVKELPGIIKMFRPEK